MGNAFLVLPHTGGSVPAATCYAGMPDELLGTGAYRSSSRYWAPRNVRFFGTWAPLLVGLVLAWWVLLPMGEATAVDALEPPRNVRVLDVGDGYLSVAWDAGARQVDQDEPEGYRILYRLVDSITPGSVPAKLARAWLPVHPASPDDPMYGPADRQGRVDDLDNDAWYEVTVAAVSPTVGRLLSKEVVTARPSGGPGAERRPPGSVAVSVPSEEPGSVSIAWSPPVDDGGSSVIGYEVWHIETRGFGVFGNYAFSGEVGVNEVLGHTIDGLEDYNTYRVGVAAVNSVGRGPLSSVRVRANRDDLDPLGLLADHSFARAYSLGEDIWEVWECDVPDGYVNLSFQATVELLNRKVSPYFDWLSSGSYNPTFVEGGSVSVAAEGASEASAYGCANRVAVAERPDREARGALIVLDKHRLVSVGAPGAGGTMPLTGPSSPLPVFPANHRLVEVAASAVVPTSAYCGLCLYPDYVQLGLVAHEMGHALGWPHSFGGDRPATGLQASLGRSISEYDNPMDIMSGVGWRSWDVRHGLSIGTLAVNRYAAGWVHTDDVAIHQGAARSYWLAPIGEAGIQMLVLPTEEEGRFVSLGARVAAGYDIGIPDEGVEAYVIDQRASACKGDGFSPGSFDRLLCAGLSRRTRQLVPPPDDGRDLESLTDHVYQPGDRFAFAGYSVEIVERAGNLFRVTVFNTPVPHGCSFLDERPTKPESRSAILGNYIYSLTGWDSARRFEEDADAMLATDRWDMRQMLAKRAEPGSDLDNARRNATTQCAPTTKITTIRREDTGLLYTRLS